ncbi:hypothetical protein ACP0F4_24700, partial [Escherichia coli]|uniref:hypothetical protein n=1 Tax=Escherichia coli TaxID=562 RepID=UPI003CED52E8
RREVSALTDARKTLAYDFFRILRAPLGGLIMTAAAKFDHIFVSVSLYTLGVAVLIALCWLVINKLNHSTNKKSR